jgi:hypothetical protein
MEAKRKLNASIALLPGERSLVTPWVGGMVGPRDGQDAVGSRKITAPAGSVFPISRYSNRHPIAVPPTKH